MKISKDKYAFLILAILFVLFCVLEILSDSVYEGADNISHYNISHYAFQYPYLFLDHWGKPIFTLFSSPFSQFGFKGIIFFNIIVGLFTSFITFKIAKELKYSNSLLVIIFVTFAPYYFMMHLTALTEMLFSLLLIASVYLALKNKFVFSAIILSFIPFVRNEGIVIFPFFFLYFFINKKYKQIPYMLTGTLIYSLIGLWYFKDFFWLVNQLPYSVTSIYGSGSLFHFINNLDLILGKPLVVLLIIGILLMIYNLFKRNKSFEYSNILKAEYLIIFLPFLSYFCLHSFLWWKGMGGSMGLIRVITAVIPLASLICLKGFNLIDTFYINKKYLRSSIFVLVIGIILYMPFEIFKYPIKLSSIQKTIKEASDWLKQSSFAGNKIYYYDPSFPRNLNIDPYDNNKCQIIYEFSTTNIVDDCVLLWDAHFGPLEGKSPLKEIMESKNFKLVNYFSDYRKIDITANDYGVYIFVKTKFNEKNNNYELLKKIEKLNENKFENVIEVNFDFENSNDSRVSDEKYKSGKKSVKLNKENPFSPAFTIKLSELFKEIIPFEIETSVDIYSEYNLNENPVVLIISIENNGNSYFYSAIKANNLIFTDSNWITFNNTKIIKEIKSLNDEIGVYVWNQGKNNVYIDNLKVKIFKNK